MERRQCCCLAAGGLHSTCPDSSHFSHFLYVAGALLAIALLVVPRVSQFVYVLGLCGLFKQGLLRDWQFILLPQPPLVFTARSYEALFPWHWNPGLHGLTWGWDRLLPGVPPDFYPPHVNVGLPVLLAAALLPLPKPCHHHTMSSLPQLSISTPPTHLDEYGFFKSLVVKLP